MKTIFLLMTGCFSLVTGFSQVSKGDKLIGVGLASISYTSSKSNTSYSNTTTEYNSDGSSFSISINPTVGWFVSDGLAVGTSASISFYSSTSNSSNTANTNTSKSTSTQPSFYIGPFVRYYFGGSTKGKPFVQAGGQYGIYGGKSKSTPNTGTGSETKTKPKGDWNAGAIVGYEHFISQYVGIYASLGFNYGSSKATYEYRPTTGTGYDYTSTYSRWYIPVGIGLQVHLPGKAKK